VPPDVQIMFFISGVDLHGCIYIYFVLCPLLQDTAVVERSQVRDDPYAEDDAGWTHPHPALPLTGATLWAEKVGGSCNGRLDTPPACSAINCSYVVATEGWWVM